MYTEGTMKYKIPVLSMLLVTLLTSLIFTHTVFAHQPYIVTQSDTRVDDPEISKAYYGILSPQNSHVYYISSNEPFEFYTQLLVPYSDNPNTHIVAEIVKNDSAGYVTMLDGSQYVWEKFHEPFGNDTYLKGPEFKAALASGVYSIRIYSKDPIDNIKYSLAIGEKESFDLHSTLHTITTIPTLKTNFFETNPITFFFSPIGFVYILVLYILAFIFGLFFQYTLRYFFPHSKHRTGKNIGKSDKVARLVLAVTLLLSALTTTWNPIFIFASGFLFFEVAFSWCGFYAMIGKKTCPM